ncbi:MAG: PqqD family protein [Pseudomonadota bacterium]|nr:PqqD family protein [Pseudomonadota bacterium]
MSGRRFRLAEGVLAQTALEEAVLLDARVGSYFGANLSASLILRMLIEGSDEVQILQAMRTKFDAPDAQLGADLRQCLDDWQQRGLILALP